MKSTLLYSILILFAFLNFSCETKKTETDDHDHQTASPEVAPADTVKKSIPKEEHAQMHLRLEDEPFGAGLFLMMRFGLPVLTAPHHSRSIKISGLVRKKFRQANTRFSPYQVKKNGQSY